LTCFLIEDGGIIDPSHTLPKHVLFCDHYFKMQIRHVLLHPSGYCFQHGLLIHYRFFCIFCSEMSMKFTLLKIIPDY